MQQQAAVATQAAALVGAISGPNVVGGIVPAVSKYHLSVWRLRSKVKKNQK